VSAKAEELAARTYRKIHRTIFKQPFVYDKLNVKNWLNESEEGKPNSTFFIADTSNKTVGIKQNLYTKWDIINREQDLRLFINVPVACSSSITILEGDFRGFNDTLYIPENGNLIYKNNHCVLNFNTIRKSADTATNIGDGVDLNAYKFKPISRLQLLAFNTGESYPFADRLVEYLSGSAITPIDPIVDNIKRVQRVMKQNRNYFKIEGLWEDKMKNILYDYIMSAGPIEIVTIGDDRENDPANYGKKIYNLTDYKFKTKQVLRDRHTGNNPKNYGYHPVLGHRSKSSLYDVLGYVDKDAEKLYASWFKQDNKAQTKSTIQDVDIYDGLYDI
jgi:hypothetical protein